MAKLTLDDLANLENEVSAVATIASNNAATETALENTLSRDGTSPNTMEATLDMNSNRIINLPEPVALTEPLRLSDLVDELDVNFIDNSNIVSPFMVTLLDDTTAAIARDTLEIVSSIFPTSRALTASGALLTTDTRGYVTLGGSAMATLSLPAVATAGAKYWVFLKNVGTRRWGIDPNGSESIDGASDTLFLYPRQGCILVCDGSSWRTIGKPLRWQLVDNPTTIYVSTTGDDANDGLAVGSPITLTTAQSRVRTLLDQNGCSVTVQLADGTYAQTFSQMAGHWTGHHNLEFHGNSGNQNAVVIAAPNSGDFAAYVSDYARVIFRYMRFEGHASANSIVVEQHGTVGVDTVTFAGCNTAIRASIGGNFKTNGVITLEGTHTITFQATTGGMIELGSSAHVVSAASGGYICSYCASANDAMILVDPGTTISGAGFAGATGQKYLVSNGGIIDSGGNSVDFFPGNSAGTIDRTSYYVGTGIGGTVTQATSKSTAVTLHKMSGAITMNNAALASGAEVNFTVTNSHVVTGDVIVIQHSSAGTAGAYMVQSTAIGTGTFGVTITNLSAGSLSEAIVLSFVVIKGVHA